MSELPKKSEHCSEHEHHHEHCHCGSHEHNHEHCGCATHEHSCSCCHHEGDYEENGKIKLIRIIAAAVLFAAGLIFNKNEIISTIIFIAAYLTAGYDVLLNCIKHICKGYIFDENFLMSVAGIGAFLIGEHPEAAAVMLFYQVGEMLQDKAVENSRRSITELMDIRPEYANLQCGESFKKVALSEVSVGDIVLVNPGERIPLDGTITRGSSQADCKALTGESKPVSLNVGDEVLSGSLNSVSPICIKVSKPYEQSTVKKILDLTEHARDRKAKSEKFITSFAKYYTPIVVFFALALALIPSFITGEWSKWLYRGLVFLAVSCPCALVISIPLGFFSGIGCGSKHGILVKGSNYLERLNALDCVVFDKTGTLTKGLFSVLNIETSMNKNEFLRICALGEYHSNHPIAVSIKQSCPDELDISQISGYKEIAGEGISVNIDGKEVLLGNSKLIKNAPPSKKCDTVVYVSIDGDYVGRIEIGDEIKPDSKQTISSLNSMGIKTVMLSGDCDSAAQAVGNNLGMSQVYSELLPQDKVSHLKKLLNAKPEKKFVAYCGDGINDAPVLALSDIGISMGQIGSDSAVEASDIVLMTDNPSLILTAVKIAKKTMFIVKENIAFALGIKLLIMILGAFGFANIWLAIFADVGVALIAIANSLRALHIKK